MEEYTLGVLGESEMVLFEYMVSLAVQSFRCVIWNMRVLVIEHVCAFEGAGVIAKSSNHALLCRAIIVPSVELLVPKMDTSMDNLIRAAVISSPHDAQPSSVQLFISLRWGPFRTSQHVSPLFPDY